MLENSNAAFAITVHEVFLRMVKHWLLAISLNLYYF